MGILKKMGHALFCFYIFLFLYFFVFIFQKKKEKKETKRWLLGFDLIPSSFVFHSFYRCVHTHFHVKTSTL